MAHKLQQGHCHGMAEIDGVFVLCACFCSSSCCNCLNGECFLVLARRSVKGILSHTLDAEEIGFRVEVLP